MADPKLYIIATPLGNRNDITLRALETLRRLTTFFAEDSRELMKLLELYEIPHAGKRIHSYAKHNMKAATERALECLRAGEEVGMASDRGTPAISDPGSLLVRAARDEGYPVIPIPGPSSVVAVLSVSGRATDRFTFLGFLPTVKKEFDALFDWAAGSGLPICFFESPKRVRHTVATLAEKFPRGRIFWGREMTKVFEEFSEMDLSQFDDTLFQERGEYTLVLEAGASENEANALDAELNLRLGSDRDWSKAVAARLGVAASEVYNALQQRKRDPL